MKICPYLAVAWITTHSSYGELESDENDETLYCVKERCEMWSTTMKACSKRNFFDDRGGSPSGPKAKEVTKEQLVDMLEEKGGLGGDSD